MDEEQGLASPISGSLQGIRRSVSSSIFTGRALPQINQPDPQTTSLISQNSLALTTVSNQLANISEQVVQLNTSLLSVKENLELSDALDRQREAEQRKREAILAEQGLREGKESELEKKIQFSLLNPVKRVAEKTQGILNQLGNFFAILLGGWLANTTLNFLTILSEKNIDKFNEFKRKLAADLLTIGGIILIGTVGIKKLITLSASLASNAFRITFGAILRKPFESVVRFVKNLVVGAKNGIGKALGEVGEGVIKRVGKGILKVLPFAALGLGGLDDGPPVTGSGSTPKSNVKVTGDVIEEAVESTAKKGFGRFFQNPFAKKTAREGAETIATKGTKIGLRKILGKLFGPIVNFLVDLSFGEKVERALAGAVGFAGASAFAAKLFLPVAALPIPGARLLYGALVLGGGLAGEQGAKALLDGIMGMFGKGKGEEKNIKPAESSVSEKDIKEEKEVTTDSIPVALKLGSNKEDLITPVTNNRDLVASRISSLEEPTPTFTTLDLGQGVIGGSQSADSSNVASNNLPIITSSDATNPYISFSESIYGVLA